jgi:hypothetical protein
MIQIFKYSDEPAFDVSFLIRQFVIIKIRPMKNFPADITIIINSKKKGGCICIYKFYHDCIHKSSNFNLK